MVSLVAAISNALSACLSQVGGISGALLFGILAYIVYTAIYNRYFHPLCHIPGPLYSSLFPGYTVYMFTFTNVMDSWLELHETYGPLVRFEPNRVSFADKTAVKTIYGTHAFPKSPHYTSFDIDKVHQTFSTIDVDVSKKRKRMLGPSFSAPNIAKMEELIHEVGAKMMVGRLHRQYGMQSNTFMPVDLLNVFFELTFGVIGRMAFGKQMIHVEDDDTSELRTVQLMKSTDKGMLWQTMLPRWSWDIARDVLGIKELVDLKEIVDYAHSSISERYRLLESGEEVKADLLQLMMDAVDPETGDKLTRSELASDLLILCFAGVDTSSHTLTWTFDLLFQHPDIMAKLEAEVLEAFPDRNERITYKVAKEQLPYMDAVLTESMRIRPVSGMFLPRVVPEGGRQIGNVFIPAGCGVGALTHVMHNYSQYWDSPEIFKPERFLEGTPEEIAARRQLITPFSIGVRSCIGRQLAMVELVVGLATIIQHFEIRPAQVPYTAQKSQFGFVISPVSHCLKANIRPRR